MKKQNKVAFFNILSTVLLQGLSIITAPLFSRLLGTEGYGIVSIYLVWVNALQIGFTLLTYRTLVNARIEYPQEEQNRYQSSVLSLSLGFFAICAAVMLAFLGPVSQLLKLPRIIVILMLLQVLSGYCVNFVNTKFTYELRADMNFYLSITVALVTLGLSLVLIQIMPPEQSHYGRILALVVTNVLIGGACGGYVLLKGKCFYQRHYWKFCAALSLPLVFYNLSDLILGYTDRLMLQHMMDEAVVGQYSLACSFGTIMFTIFNALNNTWVPFFYEDYRQGRRESMDAQAKHFLELFTVLAMGFVLLTPEVYRIFAGQEFWPGTNLVPLFVTGFYLNFLCTFPVNVEHYHKKTRAVAIVTIAASLVNIVLNYVWIQSMDAFGAALSTAVSHGVQLTLHYLYVRYFVCGKDYPFPVKLWAGHLLVYFGAVVLFYLTPDAALLRWGFGGVLGLWELWRIKKRKVLI